MAKCGLALHTLPQQRDHNVNLLTGVSSELNLI